MLFHVQEKISKQNINWLIFLHIFTNYNLVLFFLDTKKIITCLAITHSYNISY